MFSFILLIASTIGVAQFGLYYWRSLIAGFASASF